ncbi:hypothetical protein BS78_01G302500 [Paspalum vaginatum]|nr:hypothetical protein BS78_01G302500 [Paspalum vaginatum]
MINGRKIHHLLLASISLLGVCTRNSERTTQDRRKESKGSGDVQAGKIQGRGGEIGVAGGLRGTGPRATSAPTG